jgi:hypothetical protein
VRPSGESGQQLQECLIGRLFCRGGFNGRHAGLGQEESVFSNSLLGALVPSCRNASLPAAGGLGNSQPHAPTMPRGRLQHGFVIYDGG